MYWRWIDMGLRHLLLVVLVGTLAACSGAWRQAGPVAEGTVVAPEPAALAQFEAALAALEAGDDARAEPLLQALVTRYPRHAGPLLNLAQLQARRGELDAAAALLERALVVCSQCAASWNALGVIQRRQGRFAEAEQSYRKALAADPGYADAAFNLGVLYELYLQRPELALAEYRHFRTLAVDDTPAVEQWIGDLQRRAKPVERAVRLEDAGS